MEYYGDIKQTFAERLKGLREAAGLSQEELAERLGSSRGSISYYEKCKRTPDIEFLSAVCQYFDVNANFLLGHTENQLSANEDIGLRFGLSDKAISILEDMDLILHSEMLSAIIEHELFPKMFKYIAMYDRGLDDDRYTLDVLVEEYEFRRFQITRILMSILTDLYKQHIWGGPVVKTEKGISTDDEAHKMMLAFRKQLDNDQEATARIAAQVQAEMDAMRAAEMQRHNERMAGFDNSPEEQEGRRVRSTARKYVESVKGGGTNGND